MTSAYFKSLGEEDQQRYLEKLFDGLFPDPYDEQIRLTTFKNNVKCLPEISYPDIYNYLIKCPGIFTQENLAAYKSLEAYNFFYSGKVREVISFSSEDKGYVQVFGKVMPSQKNSLPHESWIMAKTSGRIISGHCQCMAGLGEVCSHVAALLFAVSAIVQELKDKEPSCTSKPMKWNAPATVVPADSIENISFSRPKIGRVGSTSKTSEDLQPKGSPTKLLQQLKACVPDAVLFTCISKRKLDEEETETASESETSTLPFEVDYKLPPIMTELFEERFRHVLPEVLSVVVQAKLDSLYVEDEEINSLERITLSQAESELWHIYRNGRITASTMHEVLNRQENSSAVPLLQKLMGYKKDNLSFVSAIKWGKSMEKTAIQQFIKKEAPKHTKFIFKAAGLVISKSSPFLGASPDGYVFCECCGKNTVEVKCPHSLKSVDLEKDLLPASFYLDGDRLLKRKHKYYTQVQAQMAVTKSNHCFFVVWNPNGFLCEKIPFDKDFWRKSMPIVKNFFQSFLLPEILTRRLEEQAEDKSWCFCQKPEAGRMVACDSSTCLYTWFHFSCAGLSRKPRGKWFCSECKTKQGKKAKSME